MPKIVPYKKAGKTHYMFKIYTGINPKTRKKGFTTRRGFKTKSEAKIELSRLEALIRSGNYYTDTEEVIDYTFGEVFEMFWENYKLTVRESTAFKTRSMYKNQILPYFEKEIIRNISTKKVQTIVNQKWSHYQICHTIIGYTSKVFEYAIDIEVIDSNPVKRIIKPKIKPKKKGKDFWSKEELKTFLEAAKDFKNPQAYPLFRLLAFTGIRKGEALALKWSDVDTVEKTISVTKTMAMRQGGQYIENTKNNNNRKVSIDEETLNVLSTLKGNEFVFENYKGKMLDRSMPRHWLREICEEIHLTPIKIHGLRHTHASLLFEAGASIKEVQARLGHANVQMTLDVYTHVTEQSRDEFAEKFSNFIDF